MAVTKDRRNKGNSLWLVKIISGEDRKNLAFNDKNNAKLLIPTFLLKTLQCSVKCYPWQYIDIYISIYQHIYFDICKYASSVSWNSCQRL